MSSVMTKHAQQRHQQRAIPSLVTALLIDYGAWVRHHGADVHYLDKAARKRLREAVGGDRNVGVIRQWMNSYVVVGDDGAVITVGRRKKRLKRP